MERRLAAILAADVVGYSRLMGADEPGTLAALRELRAELFDPLIDTHHGRTIKLMGDGTLVEFASVVDAVNCAIAVQEALATRNADLPEDRRLQLRIGINLGDVMVEGDDLYGDGVNVAARLESIAEPGGICVSDAVAQQARGKVAVGFEDLGEQELKNIEVPVKVWRVTVAGEVSAAPPVRRRASPRLWYGVAAALILLVAGGWWVAKDALVHDGAAAIDIDNVLTIKGPMVAVLPFENRGDKAHDGFARGMTEQLAAALTRYVGIRVMSPRLATTQGGDIAALRDLGASYVIDGSVARTDAGLRVNLAMTNADNGSQIWAETFKAALTPQNVHDVQDQVAGKIASSIASFGGQIRLDQNRATRAAAPGSMEALDCVIGASTWARPAEMHRLYRCALQTVETDPDYAGGWRLLSYLYMMDHYWGYAFQHDDAYDPQTLALSAGQRAVELAPNYALAQYILARAYLANGQYDQFEAAARRAIELNPLDAGMIGEVGRSIAFTGRYDEGNALIRKALDFNPSVVHSSVYYTLAAEHYMKGEYAEAMDDYRKTFVPGFWLNDLVSAHTYAAWGKDEEARAAVAALLGKRPGFVIEDAVELNRKYHYPKSFLDKMAKDLARAGLKSRGS